MEYRLPQYMAAEPLGRGQLVDGNTILCCPWIHLKLKNLNNNKKNAL
jgi:hypothetical protein